MSVDPATVRGLATVRREYTFTGTAVALFLDVQPLDPPGGRQLRHVGRPQILTHIYRCMHGSSIQGRRRHLAPTEPSKIVDSGPVRLIIAPESRLA